MAEIIHRIAEMVKSRPFDGRRVTLHENRGGWRWSGIEGRCICLSEDGKHMVIQVWHDPGNYWPSGMWIMATLDHETNPVFWD